MGLFFCRKCSRLLPTSATACPANLFAYLLNPNNIAYFPQLNTALCGQLPMRWLQQTVINPHLPENVAQRRERIFTLTALLWPLSDVKMDPTANEPFQC